MAEGIWFKRTQFQKRDLSINITLVRVDGVINFLCLTHTIVSNNRQAYQRGFLHPSLHWALYIEWSLKHNQKNFRSSFPRITFHLIQQLPLGIKTVSKHRSEVYCLIGLRFNVFLLEHLLHDGKTIRYCFISSLSFFAPFLPQWQQVSCLATTHDT